MIMKNLKKITIPEGVVKVIRCGGQILWQSIKEVLKTISGIPPLNLFKSVGKDIENYKIEGNSVQGGTPSIDAPIEIESVGEKVENLFDIHKNYTIVNTSLTASGSYGTKSGDTFIINMGGYGAGLYFYKKDDYMQLKKGYYTISADIYLPSKTSLTVKSIVFGLISPTIIGATTSLSYTKTKSIPNYDNWYHMITTIYVREESLTYLLRIQPSGNAGAYTWLNCQIKNIQVEKGVKSTVYENLNKYKIPLVAKGKNLFDFDKIQLAHRSGMNANYWTDVVDEKIYFGGSYGADSGEELVFPVEEDKTYTFSFRNCGTKAINTAQCRICTDIIDGVWQDAQYWHVKQPSSIAVGAIGSVTTKPIPKGYKYAIFTAMAATSRSYAVDNIQIEEGSVATEYEPYNKTNIYLDEPLRKIGDYVDYIDFKNKKIVRNIKSIIFNGNETAWKLTKNQTWYCFWNNYDAFGLPTGLKGTKLCNTFEYQFSAWDKATPNTLAENDVTATGNSSILFCTDYATTVTEWKQWLSAHNTEVAYVLEAPIEQPIDLPIISANEGTTVIDIDTAIKPSNMIVDYYTTS